MPNILESQFAEITKNQPELLAHHCTEAGLIEKAAGLWGKGTLHPFAVRAPPGSGSTAG
jgi:hypothetical protein